LLEKEETLLIWGLSVRIFVCVGDESVMLAECCFWGGYLTWVLPAEFFLFDGGYIYYLMT